MTQPRRPDPDDEQIRALGKLVYRSTQLEQLVTLAVYHLVGDPDLFHTIAGRPNLDHLVDLVRRLLVALRPELVDAFDKWASTARPAIVERNRLVHAWWLFDRSDPAGPRIVRARMAKHGFKSDDIWASSFKELAAATDAITTAMNDFTRAVLRELDPSLPPSDEPATSEQRED